KSNFRLGGSGRNFISIALIIEVTTAALEPRPYFKPDSTSSNSLFTVSENVSGKIPFSFKYINTVVIASLTKDNRGSDIENSTVFSVNFHSKSFKLKSFNVITFL